MNFDDLPDDNPPQEQAQQSAPMMFDDLPSFDDMPNQQQEQPYSQAGSAAIGAATALPAAAGGLAAGFYGGAAITGASAPLLGPAAPVAGVIGGIGIGLGAGALISKGTTSILNALGFGPDIEKAATDNPEAFFTGGLAANAVGLRPGGTAIQRGIGGAIGAGAEGLSQVYEGKFDPTHIGEAALFGAGFPNANRVGQKFIDAGEAAGARYRGGKNPNIGGQNTTPDRPVPPAEETPVNRDLKVIEDAAVDETEFTLGDDPHTQVEPPVQQPAIETAQDHTTTELGVAPVNPPPVELPGTGQPEGHGAGPNKADASPTHYPKDNATPRGENTGITSGDIAPDVMAARTAEEPPGRVETGIVPEQPQPSPRPLPQRRGRVRQPRGEDDFGDAAIRAAEARGEKPDEVPAPAPKPEPKPVEQAPAPKQELAPLTGAEEKWRNGLRQIVAGAPDGEKALARLDEMHPRQQHDLLVANKDKIKEYLPDGWTINAEGRIRKTGKKKLTTGSEAKGGSAGEAQQAAIDRADNTYKQFGPQSELGKQLDLTNKADVDAYAKAVWKRAMADGDPLGFVPRAGDATKDTYQWLRGVRKAAQGRGRDEFVTLHGAKGGMGALDAETKNIERTSHGTRDVTAPVTENRLERLAHSTTGREEMPPSPHPVTPGADQSFLHAHNELRSYVDNLSDKNYERLQAAFPDEKLADLVRETFEPIDVQHQFEMALRPRGPITTEVSGKPKRLNIPQMKPETQTAKLQLKGGGTKLVERAEAAGPAKSLDKNSPEFRRIAEQTLAQFGEKKTPRDVEQRIAEEKKALDGTSFAALAEKFVKDQEGSVPVPAFLTPDPVFHNPVAKEAVEHLNKEFNVGAGKTQNVSTKLMANYVTSQSRPSLAVRRDMYQRAETGQAFTPEQQKYYDETIKPLEKWHGRLTGVAERAGLLPDNFAKFPGVTARFVPRYTAPDPVGRSNDAPWRRTFSSMADPLKERDFFSLDDAKGNRVLFKMNDAGEMLIFRNKNASKLKSLPDTFTGALGDTLSLKNTKTGKMVNYMVDHATATEIEHNTGLTFVKDLEMAYSNAIEKTHGAAMRDSLIKRVKNDPRMKDLSTTDREVATEKKWDLEPTTLKELATTRSGGVTKQIYYDPRVRWWLDDMARPGIDDKDFMRKINNAAAAMAKPLYFTSPLFHVLNVGQNWTLAMGQDALRFRTYPRVAAEAMNAMKEVFTQGKLVQEFSAAGGRPMLHSQLMDGGMMSQLMSKSGMPIPKKPSIFDPLSKAIGVPVADILHQGMVASNKIMWAGNDMFALALYQRNRRMGMSPRDAVDATERWIGAYRPDSQTFGGSRVAQKLLNTPALSWFGPYHQDLWRSVGNIAKGLTTQAGDAQMRREAIGALAMGSVMMFVVYPMLLDKAAQLISGNEDSEFGRRGLLAIPDAVMHMVKGDRDHVRLAQQVLTPSIPVNLVSQGITNKDWKGQDIAPAGSLADPSHLAKTGARLADWALGIAVPPIGSMNTEARQPEGGVLNWGKRFLESGVGIKDPTEGSVRFENQLEKRQNRTEKTREKKPGGLLEAGVNRLFD